MVTIIRKIEGDVSVCCAVACPIWSLAKDSYVCVSACKCMGMCVHVYMCVFVYICSGAHSEIKGMGYPFLFYLIVRS